MGDKPLLPMIESALGFSQLEAIAAHSCVSRLIFGTYDFRADLGLGSDPEDLLYFSSRLVLASRAAGISAPVDGVTADVVHDAGWVAKARRSRSLGFGGKLCIHPRQVAAINEGFAPNEDEIRWATRILEGSRRQGGRGSRWGIRGQADHFAGQGAARRGAALINRRMNEPDTGGSEVNGSASLAAVSLMCREHGPGPPSSPKARRRPR